MSFFVNTMVCGFSLYQILAFFLIYSCLGWCLEVIYAAVSTGQLVNRGFLNGPVCPIYGFGMIIVLFALTPLQHSVLLLYLGGVILPSALELVGGWALYKLYHTRWWDYSDYPFNIGGYICLEFSLLWGVGTLIVMKLVHPIIADAVALIPPLVGLILMFLLYALYAADTIATAFAASDLARDLDALEKVADSMHAVSDAMTELLGTNAMAMDQKMDESRLQFKLAAAEARDNAAKLNAREAVAAMRAKADEAMEAAKRASQDAKLNASEAANAVKLAAKGRAERTAELFRLEQLAEELQARSEELRSRTQRATHKGDANSKCNVGIAEASHQPVVNHIAGPENGGKERTKQANNRDNKVPHSKLIICGQFIFHLWNQGLNPVVQQLSGLSGPLFFLVHRAKVQAESSNDQYRNHGKYAIQIERKHIQPDAPCVALNAACQQLCGNQSRDKGTIAANGRKRS